MAEATAGQQNVAGVAERDADAFAPGDDAGANLAALLARSRKHCVAEIPAHADVRRVEEVAILDPELHAFIRDHEVVEEILRQAIANVAGPGHEQARSG